MRPTKRTRPFYKAGAKGKSKTRLYPTQELAALSLDDSSEEENDRLDTEEEVDLEEEAARYEEERYHPDEKRAPGSSATNRGPSRVVPSAPPPY